MSFLSGRVTFLRYRVRGRGPKQFGPEHLDRLKKRAIGKQRTASADGVEIGWGAGQHILDTRFGLEKNIIHDTLCFELRVDALKLPGELLRAYTEVELEGMAATNPSGRASVRQRREARQKARERLEHEARDGRFVRRKGYPVLWDAQANELLVGTTSATALGYLHRLFPETFEQKIEPVGAGLRAYLLAEPRGQTRGADDATLTAFAPGGAVETPSWIMDEKSRDFLGNEFLLWLWFTAQEESDTIELSDQSTAAVMLSRLLVLECPRGETGQETIRSDGPAQLPEAHRAIQSGKLPRRAGLTVVRHDRSYELKLSAENLAVSGAKLPGLEEEEERAQLAERVDQVRELIETLDLLYDAFGQRRLGAAWSREVTRMQKWLQQDRKGRLTVTA